MLIQITAAEALRVRYPYRYHRGCPWRLPLRNPHLMDTVERYDGLANTCFPPLCPPPDPGGL